MTNLTRYYLPWAAIFLLFAALAAAGVLSIHAKITPRTAITAPEIWA